MKKLMLVTAALALAAIAVPAAIDQAQAAPAKSPFCNMPAQKWNTNWGQYYKCYGMNPARPHVKAVHAIHHKRLAPGTSPYCNIPSEKWNINWGQYYHCFGRI
jgi:hypothetical protein